MKYNPLTKFIIIFLSFSAIVWLLSFLRPVGDDWGYYTVPRSDLLWADLLPQGNYWRPFDILYGRLLGFFPGLFPFLNHTLVALGHFISIYLLSRILGEMNLHRRSRITSILFFALSPGIVATLYSVDSLNQTWALTFGAVGTLLYFNANPKVRITGWILFSILATLSKESGIVWFIATPLFGFIIKTRSIREVAQKGRIRMELLRSLGLAAAFVLFYFFLRMVIFGNSGGISNSDPEERYHLSVFSINFIRNVLLISSTALTSIDSAALFLEPRRNILVVLTILLNLPFIALLAVGLYKAIKMGLGYKVAGLIVVAAIVSSPHLVLAQSAEMHGYPTVFMVSMIVGLFIDNISWNKKVFIAIICYFVSAVITDVHKWNLMYKYGKSGEEIGLNLLSQTKVLPEKVLIIQVNDSRPGYSVFWQNPLMAFYNGISMKPYYNWDYPKESLNIIIENQDEDEIRSEIDRIVRNRGDHFNCIWIIHGDQIRTINNY